MGNLTEKLDLSLLYVEDDEDISESIISLLERRIAKVYSARDGLEGLKLFEQVHPDIIVTDIKMPEMDGLKMSQKIKEISPDTQIIIMSAFSDLDYLIQAINSGINQYILKPMDFGKLFTAIQKASYVVNLKKENERQKLELLEAKTRAETATKLKDRFVKLVAHDLKSPFLGILQFMDLLSTYPSLQNEPDLLKIIQTIQNKSKAQIKIIDSILNINRLQSEELYCRPSLHNIYNLVESAIQNSDVYLQTKQIQVSNEIDKEISFSLDYELIMEALVNLISNSVKFSKRGQRIRFFIPENHPKTIAISDEGIGMSEAELQSINQDSAVSKLGTEGETGTGLGLQFCKTIMELHKGKFYVESHLGVGTTFYLEFTN